MHCIIYKININSPQVSIKVLLCVGNEPLTFSYSLHCV